MDNAQLWALLRELGILYAKTKGYILRAEEVDSKLRSNISVFKEQRDGLDHVMRALTEHLEKAEGADEKYIREQIENAKGHIFRAAYDALDGTGISFKIRISKAIEGISNEAITAVCPDYWQRIVELDEIDEQIASHRRNKDERRSTIENLDTYCLSIERLHELAKAITVHVPNFQEWERRQRGKARRTLIILPIVTGVIIGIVLFLLGLAKDAYLKSSALSRSVATPTPTASSSASPSVTRH